MVNVAGFLAFQRLTTNVTGHFAFLWMKSLNWFFYKLWFIFYTFFSVGSFVSGFLRNLCYEKKMNAIFIPLQS